MYYFIALLTEFYAVPFKMKILHFSCYTIFTMYPSEFVFILCLFVILQTHFMIYDFNGIMTWTFNYNHENKNQNFTKASQYKKLTFPYKKIKMNSIWGLFQFARKFSSFTYKKKYCGQLSSTPLIYKRRQTFSKIYFQSA